MTSRRRCSTLLVALVAALALATAAGAEIVTRTDTDGRSITFDVQAPSVDVDWYAAILRAAAHGDEISRVTIRIVREEDVPELCGAAAAACYSPGRNGGRMVVPAGKAPQGRSDVPARVRPPPRPRVERERGPELNGTPVWWQLRGMAALAAQGTVAFDYSRGWDRSVGEIFAEDYAWIHIPYQHAITWLSPPDEALRTALFAELGGQPAVQLPEIPAAGPLVINRSGTLAAKRSQIVPFGLLGPGRRVTLTATVNKATRAGTRARMEVTCNGTRVATQLFTKGRATRTINVPNLGPGECSARLVSTTGVKLTYTLRLRLAIET